MDYGETSFFFSGDAEIMSEEMMLGDGIPLKADVLKVAHHGSRYSSSPEFLAAVRPEWAVISCGNGNAYGHPNENVLERLNNLQCKIYRTDLNGNVVAGKYATEDGNVYYLSETQGDDYGSLMVGWIIDPKTNKGLGK